jgi:uncharacterized protein YacL
VPVRSKRRSRDLPVPPSVIEVLRFCIVVFMAALSYELSRVVPGTFPGLGPFDRAGVGTVLGAGAGYVVGGILGRMTGRSLRAAEDALLGRSVEQVLAGVVGSAAGVVAGVALSWPLLLVRQPLLTGPLMLFVCVTTGSLGHRVGMSRRQSVLSLLAPRAGLAATRAPLAALPRLVDSSVAVDGRVLDVVRAGFLHGTLIVVQPVIDELQGLADAGDDARRAKGRRGLETLDALRRERGVDVEVVGDEAPEVPGVDAKLLRMTLDREAVLLTLDSNLAKAATIAGCRVMNLHALVVALRPPVSAGDTVTVLLARSGKEPGQAVGHLDDGTMVVVERAKDRIGQEIGAVVTSVLTTGNGRMVFARRADAAVPRPASPPGGPSGHPSGNPSGNPSSAAIVAAVAAASARAGAPPEQEPPAS